MLGSIIKWGGTVIPIIKWGGTVILGGCHYHGLARMWGINPIKVFGVEVADKETGRWLSSLQTDRGS